MTIRPDDLAADINRWPYAISDEEIDELHVSLMPIVERHDESAGRKVAPPVGAHRIDEFAETDEVVSRN